MTYRSRLLAVLLFSLSALAMSLLPLPLVPAQDKKAVTKDAPPPNIAATYPMLTTAANLGLKPGTTTELVLTGTNLTDVTGIWTSFPAKTTIPEGQKDATKLTVKIDLPGDTPIGLYTYRVATKTNISNTKPLCVDTLPQVVETDKNRIKSTPQTVPNPCIVVGKADVEASDFFRFPVQSGVPVTLEVLGRRLGSPIDPVLLLYDATGKELAGIYADDTPGLQSDARITYTPKQSGELIVELRDTTYRGGADFVYRLRIGNFPGVTTAFPLAIERGKKAEINFSGPNAKGLISVSLTAPKDPAITTLYATPKTSDGLAGWPVPVMISNVPQLTEQEPNNDIATANTITVPCGISARFTEKNDLDHFRFAAKKGEKFTVTALTYGVNAPTEVLMRILDAKGAELAKSNPQQALTRVDFTAPADGDFIIACEHLNYLAGPSEVYWLQVQPASPDFTITLGLDRIEVPVGGVGLLPITGIAKLNGFNVPIELSVDSESLSGKLTVPAAANLLPATPLYMVVTTKPDAKPGPHIVTLQATAKVDGKDVTRFGQVTEVVKAAFAGLPNPPPELSTQLAVAITPEPPFTLTVTFDTPEAAPGTTLKGKVVANWTKNFTGGIVDVYSLVLPANVTTRVKRISSGTNEAELELTLAANATLGTNQVIFRGFARYGDKDIAVIAPPVTITVIAAKKKEEPKKDEKKK